MKVIIAAIGKLKSGPEKQLVEFYTERAAGQGRLCGFGDIEIKELSEARAQNPTARQKEDTAKLRNGVSGEAIKIVLDERGRALTSEKFAQFLAKYRDQGAKQLVFFIGGADGLHQDVKTWAQDSISLSAMTLPHRLARVMIIEQIYRAMTILTNHPYHRD